jgi:DNA-binding HxlR family transcriptional regulator
MPTTRFGTQEPDIGAISPKMMKQQLEGDNDADLVSTTL